MTTPHLEPETRVLPEEVKELTALFRSYRNSSDEQLRSDVVSYILKWKNSIAQEKERSRREGRREAARAYHRALLELGKVSPGLLEQINALATEALKTEEENDV